VRWAAAHGRPVVDVTIMMFFMWVLLQKTNDSFENPSYRLFFGVIVCQYHKMMNRTPKNGHMTFAETWRGQGFLDTKLS
jgi:hypothetical protein